MRANLHPKLNHVMFLDATTGEAIRTRSTLSSAQRRSEAGVEWHVIRLDISAYSHPFYTGQQRMVDTEGRVDRFVRRYQRGAL